MLKVLTCFVNFFFTACSQFIELDDESDLDREFNDHEFVFINFYDVAHQPRDAYEQLVLLRQAWIKEDYNQTVLDWMTPSIGWFQCDVEKYPTLEISGIISLPMVVFYSPKYRWRTDFKLIDILDRHLDYENKVRAFNQLVTSHTKNWINVVGCEAIRLALE